MKTINIHNSTKILVQDFLEENFKNIQNIDSNSISIKIESYDELSKLALRLAMYSVYFVENKVLTKLKKHLTNGYFNEEIFNQVQNQDFKYLYVGPLQIIYTEYLKDNTSLDLESFLTFNCRGLEKDFFMLSKDYLHLYKDEVSSNSIKIKGDSNNEEKSTQKYYLYIEELYSEICKMKDNFTVKDADYKRFDTIHVKVSNERIILTDPNNNPLDNYIEELLNLKISDEFRNGDTSLKATLFILTCVSIFNTSTIIFHQSIPKNSLSRILLFLYDSKEINPELQNINLIKCSGCSLCYLK